MQEVMQCLKKYGQRLDLEIAAEMRVPLVTVRKRLAELSAAGDVVMCQLTLRRQQDDRGVAVLGVGVRSRAGPGQEAEVGVAARAAVAGRGSDHCAQRQHVRGSSREGWALRASAVPFARPQG